LTIAAQMNGKLINKSKIARDVGVNDVTVATYFDILEDTLIGMALPAFHRSVRKGQRLMPKFFFIDTGIKRALEQTLSVELLPQTSAYGDAFEHWVILEMQKRISYRRLEWSLSYFRTHDDAEIDLIVERPGSRRLLIEIKSKSLVTEEDARTLERLSPSLDPQADRWLLSCDPLPRKFGDTTAMHWQAALKEWFG
jgi:predicted AAA+ superfamily ATPase